MTITTTALTRAAGLSAVAAGALFIAVQIKHPALDATVATTTEYVIREGMKIAMAALALVGITGMYLRQTKQMGVLGLIGYLLFGAGYLILMSVEIIGTMVLPTLANGSPAYVNDVLTAANGGKALGDIGLLQPWFMASGITYLVGGLIFGIALFRANILARWAAALLSVSAVATMAIPLLPGVNQRLFAIPNGIALIGLGWSLFREQRSSTIAPASSTVVHLDPVVAP
jgi:hypothetical protein